MVWPPWKRHAKGALKFGLAILVLLALGRHVRKTWLDLAEKGESIHLDPTWIAFGGLFYLAGLAAFGVFFGKVMIASQSPISRYSAIRAYLISHLGKYVPGKAMVVITRVGLSTPYGARPATAALATFYETLVMMTGGSLIAAAGFALGGTARPLPTLPILLSLLLAVAFLITVEPRAFPWITRMVTSPFPSIGTEAMPKLSHRLLVEGLLWSFLGWTLLGFSMIAVAKGVAPEGVETRFWPLVIASVALATVAGFVVALLPAGFGVREGVLISTLAPAIGNDSSVVAALALRLTWVLAEAAAAAVLSMIRPARIDLGSETVHPGES